MWWMVIEIDDEGTAGRTSRWIDSPTTTLPARTGTTPKDTTAP
jgi:hypothetical protein